MVYFRCAGLELLLLAAPSFFLSSFLSSFLSFFHSLFVFFFCLPFFSFPFCVSWKTEKRRHWVSEWAKEREVEGIIHFWNPERQRHQTSSKPYQRRWIYTKFIYIIQWFTPPLIPSVSLRKPWKELKRTRLPRGSLNSTHVIVKGKRKLMEMIMPT